MTYHALVLLAAFLLVLVLITPPLGRFMARVLRGSATLMSGLFGWLERALYRLGGVDPRTKMDARQYTFAVLAFSLVSLLMTYAILKLQGALPWNPQHFGAAPMTTDLAFNTAVSFATHTNWQAYGGKSAMSYFSQMVGLATQNFFSAAVGLALGIAVVRGFARRMTRQIGNFWADLVRGTLYVLLPLSFVAALILVWQGVPQNLSPYVHATTLEGAAQVIPQGPVASQEAIKLIGVNGGGFFAANSAHPYENPTPLSNFVQYILIFALASGLTYTFGVMVKDTRQGWALFSAMAVLFVAGYLVLATAEQRGTPHLAGPNMEGKEVRFGIADSGLFAAITTNAACGTVNCPARQPTPIGGLVTLLDMELGKVVFGGVGSGLYGMLVFAVLAMFLAGLMVGRTPEYLGKKIEQRDVKMAMLSVLVLAASVLLFSAAAVVTTSGSASSPHGLSEILYAYTSATANNGSAFRGLAFNTRFYNFTTAFAMMLGRFFMVIPIMALAGSLAAKKYVPASTGTFPTHSPLFVGLLVAVNPHRGRPYLLPRAAAGAALSSSCR